MRLIRIEGENVLRLEAFAVDLPQPGVTYVEGPNGAGKTALLDATEILLQGLSRKRHPEPIHKGAKKGWVRGQTDTGLTLYRGITGKTANLEVEIDGDPQARPQDILDRLTSPMLDATALLDAKDAELYEMIARAAGIDLSAEKALRAELYEERTAVNRDLKRLTAQRDALPLDPGAPQAAPDRTALLAQLDQLAAHESQRQALHGAQRSAASDAEAAEREIDRLTLALREAKARLTAALTAEAQSERALEAHGPTPDPAPVRQALEQADQAAERVRQQQERRRLTQEVDRVQAEADEMSDGIGKIDLRTEQALAAAQWPVEGLSLDTERGLVLFRGLPWCQASTGQRKEVAISLAFALARREEETSGQERIRLALMREGSSLDDDTRAHIERLAQEYGFNALVEVVTGGRGPSRVVVRNGRAVQEEVPAAAG